MDSAHPVPQNVTSFQFRLVGDMTLKQFGYLATGVGIAYLAFVFLAARLPFIAWPVIVVFTLAGIAFAFIPLGERPLDHWLFAFLKAIYSPTKRAWYKNNQTASQNPSFAKRLNLFLSLPTSTPPPPPSVSFEPPPKAPPPLANQSIPSPSNEPELPKEQLSGEHLPTPEELTKTVELAHQAQTLQVKIIESERELSQIKNQVQTKAVSPTEYTEQFGKVFDNLNHLVQEASNIKKQLSTLTNEPTTPSIPKTTVKVPPPPRPRQTQLTLTSFPNVINGIVVDSNGAYLEGVVVVIHDKDGLPVRALKTNRLGQFTGSTPLPNGGYSVELERDNLVFDILQITLDGKVLPPLNIAAKRLNVN